MLGSKQCRVLFGALAVLAISCSAASTANERLTFNKVSTSNFPGAAANTLTTTEPERYSGYFKLNRTYDAHMFFFYFEAREAPADAPVVLWMTGGPGCSSELAVFYENGPFKIKDDLTLEENPTGWDVANSMIFVDQPIGTGFSYSEDDRDRCYDEDCVSNDVLDFLEALWTARPELSGRDFYVTGESYAGKCIFSTLGKQNFYLFLSFFLSSAFRFLHFY
jgi:carboxypeptidase C (cathepsin A)